MPRILAYVHALIFVVILNGCSSTNVSTNHPTHSQSPGSSINASDIEVTSVTLSDFIGPDGTKYQRVKTQLVNNSQRPVRVIEGDISWYGSDGKMIDTINYTIYATFHELPGILPGQTYTTLDDGGFLLSPNQNAASATVRVTKALEDSPM